MRRMRALGVLMLAVVSFGPATAAAQSSGTVLMYVKDGARDLHLMLTEEIGVMRSMIEDAGYDVEIVTSTGETLSAGGVSVTPDLKLADVDASRYVGFIVPCMAPAPGTPIPPEALALLEQAVASGKPIAASRGSVELVGQAGGLSGKRYMYSSAADAERELADAGGTYEGTGVVRDGNLSTAGICPLASRSLGEPDGTVDLTRSFIDSLSEAN